jgi:hypothetical protein
LRRHLWALVAATLVGAWLRIWQLGEWSLWVDEAHTWRDATMPIGKLFEEDRILYALPFLLLRGLLWLGCIDESEAGLRWPFVVLGIATVPLLGICGRRLIGPGAAVLAAGLLALNPWHVYWSQNARGYVLVVLAAVFVGNRAAAHAEAGRRRDLVALGAALAFGVMSHTTGGLLAVGFLAFLLLRRLPRLSRWQQLGLVVAIGALSLALPALLEATGLFADFRRSKAGIAPLHFLQTTAFYFRPALLLTACLGLLALRFAAGRDRALLLGCLGLVPFFVLLIVTSQVVKATARYAIGTLPVLTWLAAFAGCWIWQRIAGLEVGLRRATLGLAAMAPLLLFADAGEQLSTYYTTQRGQRAPWREAVAFLRERTGGGLLRVMTVNHPTLLYYLRPGHWQDRVAAADDHDIVPILQWMVTEGRDEGRKPLCAPGAQSHLDCQRAIARHRQRRFAIVVTMPELVEEDPAGALRAVIARDCELALYLPCWVGPKDESIYVYLPREP